MELELPMFAGKEVNHIYDEHNGAAGIKSSKIRKNSKIKIELEPEGGANIFS